MTATGLKAKALYANSADTDEELSFEAGDILTVIERDVAGLAGWWLCSHAGRIGIAPGNRLRLLSATVDSIDSNSSSRSDAKQQTEVRKQDVSLTAKHRPATAPQRGHTTLNIACSNNTLVVPYKAGNVYIYDEAAQQCVDYDVPTGRVASQTKSNSVVSTTASDHLLSPPDYDIPTNGSVRPVPCSGTDDDDVEFGVGDYDLLSPQQRPASDVDCNVSSNRSSITSVISGGSLSSGCASTVRSVQSPPTCVGRNGVSPVARTYSYDLHAAELSVPRRCVSEATSDGSVDSGVMLQSALNSPKSNGVACRQNGITDKNANFMDYDVPVANVPNEKPQLLNVEHKHRTNILHGYCPSPAERDTSPVTNGDLQPGKPADDGRRRRVEELRDCVIRNAQRFLTACSRLSSDTGRDVTATRHCFGQAKLAGLAVRTSLKELVAIADDNSSELFYSHINPLSKSLYEIDGRLDCLIAAGTDVHCSRVSGSQRTASDSTVCHDQLQSVCEIVVGLPEQVRRFTDFVATDASVVVRPPVELNIVPTPPMPSCIVSKVSPPTPPQRRDSHQRDRPPQSPTGITGSPRSRRPPLGKPPPVKPKPPKSVTWKRSLETSAERRLEATRGSTTLRPTTSRTKDFNNERRVAELNNKNRPLTDDWNEDDCDYVSIVREVEREMESLGKPVNKGSTQIGNGLTLNTSTCLNDDDRELLEFFAAQISAHAADVDVAASEFYRCCGPLLSPGASPPSVDTFVRRSRFVVLSAHRLVYVGDVIARHVTDQSVRDRVATAANTLCDRLKALVVATRHAALATADSMRGKPTAGDRQMMVNSVRQATDDSRRLCHVISAIACQ